MCIAAHLMRISRYIRMANPSAEPKTKYVRNLFKFSKILYNSCEILLFDLEAFSFQFHFLISSHFYFTFISRSRSQVIFFHLHFSERVNVIFSSLFTSRLSKTHSRRTLWGVGADWLGGATVDSRAGTSEGSPSLHLSISSGGLGDIFPFKDQSTTIGLLIIVWWCNKIIFHF